MNKNGWESILKWAIFGFVVAAAVLIFGVAAIGYLVFIGVNSL